MEKEKIVSRKQFEKLEDKYHPPFKLEKWYHYLFFAIGWIGVLNIVFWLSLLWVYYRNVPRFNRFINPATRKAVYIWGIIYTIGIALVIIL
jgi:hypothetical protein